MKPQHVNERVPVLIQQLAPGAPCAQAPRTGWPPGARSRPRPGLTGGHAGAELTGSVPSCEIFPLPLHLLQGQHAGVLRAGGSEHRLLVVPLRVLARESGH